jgi:hypothetical protein
LNEGFLDRLIDVDVRELISVDDVMEELGFGPNGGLVYCLEYVPPPFHHSISPTSKSLRPHSPKEARLTQRFLISNMDWLEDALSSYDSDYLIIDCPGQIEIFTHFPIMKSIIQLFQRLNYNCCAVWLMDCQFITDEGKYFGGVLTSLSVMCQLEIAHINVLSKMDLLGEEAASETISRYLEADTSLSTFSLQSGKYARLTEAIVKLIEDYTMVSFIPLNIADEDSVEAVLSQVDVALQWGEDEEVMERDGDAPDYE